MAQQKWEGKMRFPRDYDGNVLAKAWVISFLNPRGWLNKVIEKRHFIPRKWPEMMEPADIQRAIAMTLCPPSTWERTGIAVSAEMTKSGQIVCHAAYYSEDPINWDDMRQMTYYEAHIEAAFARSHQLVDFVTRGRNGNTVIAPLLSVGHPIGDNHAFVASYAQ